MSRHSTQTHGPQAPRTLTHSLAHSLTHSLTPLHTQTSFHTTQVPGKEEFYETLRYFANELSASTVNLQLQTRVDADFLKASGFDAVVLATGVTPRNLRIEGSDHPSVVSYVDVLTRSKTVGKRVAVIGAGGIGFDVAEFLAHDADKLPMPSASSPPVATPSSLPLLGGAEAATPRTQVSSSSTRQHHHHHTARNNTHH